MEVALDPATLFVGGADDAHARGADLFQALPEGLLVLLALGDVQAGADHPHDPAAAEDRLAARLDPADARVRIGEAMLEPEGLALERRPVDRGRHRVAVLGMHQGEDGADVDMAGLRLQPGEAVLLLGELDAPVDHVRGPGADARDGLRLVELAAALGVLLGGREGGVERLRAEHDQIGIASAPGQRGGERCEIAGEDAAGLPGEGGGRWVQVHRASVVGEHDGRLERVDRRDHRLRGGCLGAWAHGVRGAVRSVAHRVASRISRTAGPQSLDLEMKPSAPQAATSPA